MLGRRPAGVARLPKASRPRPAPPHRCRARTAGSATERAPVSITKVVKTALSRIRAQSPALADHLDATIHTGTFCSYMPDPRAPITWRT